MADPYCARPSHKDDRLFFVERVKGGTGLLIITGLVPISQGIDPTTEEDNETTYFPRIVTDSI